MKISNKYNFVYLYISQKLFKLNYNYENDDKTLENIRILIKNC